MPLLAGAWRELRVHKVAFTVLVFHLGVPSPKPLAKDLIACGIPVEDSRGWRVDFHALRHILTILPVRCARVVFGCWISDIRSLTLFPCPATCDGGTGTAWPHLATAVR